MKNGLITLGILGVLASSLSAHICDSNNCEQIADRLITQDSRSWVWNRYDRGSAEKVTNYSRKNGNDGFKVRYTYNGGSQGWAKILLTRHGDFVCIVYHDYPNTCRDLR